jgi:RNA polymerase sigma-70 factor (ECF subfamily)
VSEIARSDAERATEVDETSLLSRARSGDRAATELLVRKYLRDVYELTARVLEDKDLAQDAAQDAFVNALGALHRFRGESSFKTWLLRIALNSARSVDGAAPTARSNARSGRRKAAESSDAIDQMALAAEAKKMEALLQKLPEKQRLAVTLRLQQGLSYEEVAAALDCSEGAARVNYHLGLKRLREWAT